MKNASAIIGRKAWNFKEAKIMTKITPSSKEWLLLFVYLANEVRGRTRLQKEIYLCKEEKGIQIPYSFIPYSYGPFSIKIWNDLEELCAAGLISEEEMPFTLSGGETGIQYIYRITDEGKRTVEKRIMSKVEQKLIRKMEDVIRKYNKKDLTTILRNVYQHFLSETQL